MKKNIIDALKLCAALLAVPVSAEAQTVGGYVTVVGSHVNGDVSAVGTRGVLANSSPVGLGNTVNAYGGYSSTTMTVQDLKNVDALGGIYSENSTFERGNLSAVGLDRDVLNGNPFGYNNVGQSVGQVDLVTFNSGTATPINDLANVTLKDTIVKAGDVTAAASVESLLTDSPFGQHNLANCYGCYASSTVNMVMSGPGTASGTIYLDNTDIRSGNILAAFADASVFNSSPYGSYNLGDSVGYVIKNTYNAGTAASLGLQ